MIILGDFPDEMSLIEGRPFVGASGRLLDDLLLKNNIKREDCLLLNVFNERPPRNDQFYFFQASKGNKSKFPSYAGKLLKPEHEHHLNSLFSTIDNSDKCIILALGPIALWAITGKTGIKNYRGVTYEARSKKVIASYHPSAVHRDYGLRPILFADIAKAAKNNNASRIRRKVRSVWVAERLADLQLFRRTKLEASSEFTYDIETIGDHITHIAIATSPTSSICIPFRTLGDVPLYSIEEEAALWYELQEWFLMPKLKIAQGGLYDLTHLYNQGLVVAPPIGDTMYLAHALQPELPKALGFLGSLHCDEDAWKELRVKALVDETKDDS